MLGLGTLGAISLPSQLRARLTDPVDEPYQTQHTAGVAPLSLRRDAG